MVPLPRPISTAAATASGKVVAKANVVAAATRSGQAGQRDLSGADRVAESAGDLHRHDGRRPAVNSRIAMSVAVRSSRSRMEGRTPPYPPMISPFTANSSATATTDWVRARRGVACDGVVVEDAVIGGS